ncbi:unnamed protein product [Symbiodinium sp. CCMP2592]|nr:unnamed protein product [Symbiodinium sp. CCMP2592]
MPWGINDVAMAVRSQTRLSSQPQRFDISSDADDSTVEAPSLEEELSHLLRAKGGSMPLWEMEWAEVCMTHFKNLQELASFLESRPRRFSVRWEGTPQVEEAAGWLARVPASGRSCRRAGGRIRSLHAGDS